MNGTHAKTIHVILGVLFSWHEKSATDLLGYNMIKDRIHDKEELLEIVIVAMVTINKLQLLSWHCLIILNYWYWWSKACKYGFIIGQEHIHQNKVVFPTIPTSTTYKW